MIRAGLVGLGKIARDQHLPAIEKIDGIPGHAEGIPGYDLCPITQEQADEYIEWYQSRPYDGIGIGQGNRIGGQGFFKRGRGSRGGFGHHGGVRPTAPASTTPDATSL